MKRAYQFAEVRARGASFAGRFLILSTAPAPGGASAHSLFGIITTKRVGCAVCRNRLRRRMREILRAHAAPLVSGLYVVLIMRNRAAYADYEALERDFLKLLQRHLQTAPVSCSKSSSSCPCASTGAF